MLSFSACDLLNGDSFNANDKGKLEISFDNVVGDQDLSLTAKTYKNASGEDFTVTKLQYFISNIKLKTSAGKEYAYPQDQSYFLIREDDPASQTITLSDIPAENYTEISYVVGVDSLRNTMDISKRTGVLDIAVAAKDMYWTWNSGYIFFKMEGNAPAAKTTTNLNGAFQYHIGLYGGGFGTPVVKTINNAKRSAVGLGDQILKIRKNTTPHVDITFDVLKTFTGVKSLSIVASPVIMASPASADVANNYLKGFTFKSMHTHDD
jgi:hypothetical protein